MKDSVSPIPKCEVECGQPGGRAVHRYNWIARPRNVDIKMSPPRLGLGTTANNHEKRGSKPE